MLTVIREAMAEVGGTEQVTEQVRRLLRALQDSDLLSRDAMKAVGLRHRPTFLYTYIGQRLDAIGTQRYIQMFTRSR